MRIYFAHDTNFPWWGNYIFNAPDVEPEAWGFDPMPALTTTQEAGEAGKAGYYFLRGEVYRHTEAGSILLLVTLRRWDERAQDVVEERLAVIFREGNLKGIPAALHRIRPNILAELISKRDGEFKTWAESVIRQGGSVTVSPDHERRSFGVATTTAG